MPRPFPPILPIAKTDAFAHAKARPGKPEAGFFFEYEAGPL